MKPLMIGMPGTTELLIIAAILTLLFGGKKLPELMRGMGQGIRELKRGVRAFEDETEDKKEEKKIGTQSTQR